MPDIDLSELFSTLDRQYRYQYDLFISYSFRQQDRARALYNRLKPDLEIFFAQESIATLDQPPDQFVGLLQDALVRSCQTVVLLSSDYLESAWCQLEMYGFFNLLRGERRRRMWILPLEPVTGELAGQLTPFLVSEQRLEQVIRQAHNDSGIRAGDKFGSSEPMMFIELPLRERYEPPRASNRPPWGKDHRSPHGIPGAPGYAVYEQLVREYMVQILRGNQPGRLSLPVSGDPVRYDYMPDDAKADARDLIKMDVSPFQGPFRPGLGDTLRDIAKARSQGQDGAMLDRLEGSARVHAGQFDAGIRLIEQGLSADLSDSERDACLVEIAQAHVLAGRFEKSQQTLQRLHDPESGRAQLVTAVTRARLGLLDDRERKMNHDSEIRVDDLRIDSPLARRQDLDFWAEGLEMAGFQEGSGVTDSP